MAHELDYNAATGKAAMFSVIETPWHNEGVLLHEAPSLDVGLALAGLDFVVEKRRAFVAAPGNTEAGRLSDLAYVTVRADRELELGSVGPDYTVLQNADAFRVLEPLLDSGIAKLETGGSLREGRDVWMLVRFDVEHFGPIVREVFADELVPFGLIRNNHAGTRAAAVALTPVRVVCANTMALADQDIDRGLRAQLVRHTGDPANRLIEAAEMLFEGLVERYETLARYFRALKASFLTDEQFRSLVLEPIVPDPRNHPNWTPEARMAEAVLARATAKRVKLLELWRHGKGHVGDNSAWEAYSGVVEALDHESQLWPTRSGVYRTAALMHGHLGRLKSETLNRLVTFAQREG